MRVARSRDGAVCVSSLLFFLLLRRRVRRRSPDDAPPACSGPTRPALTQNTDVSSPRRRREQLLRCSTGEIREGVATTR